MNKQIAFALANPTGMIPLFPPYLNNVSFALVWPDGSVTYYRKMVSHW
jgi:hypothetical protein